MEFFYDNERDGGWDSQRAETVRTIRESFVPVILDSYLTGTPVEKAFVDRLGRGGTNCLVVAAASGKQVGTTARPGELRKLLEQYRALPEPERKPSIEKETGQGDADKIPPALPEGGLTFIVYQAPIARAAGGEFVRAANLMAPGPSWRLKVPITMNDLVWATPEERKGLIPDGPAKGQKLRFPESLSRRIFVTQGYEWNLAYQNNTLALRAGELAATVEEVTAKEVRMRLEGFSKVGGTEEEIRRCGCEGPRACPHWGCDLAYTGVARIDRARQAIVEFRLIGLGETWTRLKREQGVLGYGSEICRYPTGLAIELPSDCPANRGGWPPLAPQRLRASFDYWTCGRK